jgi:hypothetical protein
MSDIARLEQALIAADAAGDTAAATELAAALRAEMATQSQPKQPQVPEASPLKKAVSAAVRPIANAAAGLPLLALDAGAGLANFLREGRAPRLSDFNPFVTTSGTEAGGMELPSASFRRGLDQYTAAPEGAGKAAELVSTLLLGSRIPTGQLPQQAPAGFQIPPRAPASSSASAASGAQASATPGAAAAGANVSGGATARGTGGGYTFGTVGDDASAGLTPAQRQIMDRGRQMGFRTTPGQATGSRALQQLEAKLESQPMTSGPFNTLKEGNAKVLNRAAARSIGENADSLDSAVLDRAVTRIGQVFDDAADDVPRTIDPDEFLQRFAGLEDETSGLVTGLADHPLIQDVTKLASSGQATGKQLQSLTSKLGKSAYKQMSTPSGDRDLGLALYRAKDYVDDLLQQGMDPKRVRTFQQARDQYRNLMLLTSRTSVVNPSTGNVQGRSLANVLQSKDKGGFLFGRNQSDMYDAARFTQAFQPIVGDSGTATRSALPSPTDFVLSLPFNIATRAYTSSPAVNLAVGSQAAANAAGGAARDIVRGGLFSPAQPGAVNPLLLPPAYEGLLNGR